MLAMKQHKRDRFKFEPVARVRVCAKISLLVNKAAQSYGENAIESARVAKTHGGFPCRVADAGLA
jgi:hypothetical protein